MSWVRIWQVAALMTALVFMPTAAAVGEDASIHVLGADVSKPGIVTLTYFGLPGSTVYFDERIGGVVKRIGHLPIAPDAFRIVPPAALIFFPEATVWRCGRPARHFESTEVRPDGTRAAGAFDVRTGTCARRFALKVPSRVRRGTLARVRVLDRWNIGGIGTRLCVTPPHGHAACRSLPFRRAIGVRSRHFRATRSGQWKVELRVHGHRERTAVAVGSHVAAERAATVVLATGDSLMQGIDSFIADRLGQRARVRSDVHNGTAISRDGAWVARARRQAQQVKPRTTVISVGAGEGYPMRTPSGTQTECCDASWSAEYRRRLVAMMKSYRRGGAGRVLWLAVPLPRSPALAAVTAVVNKAILSAAAGRPGVKVLRIDQLITPNGYRDVMRYRGQDVRVRAVDGVHLSIPGTAIVAEAVDEALRNGW